MSRRISWGSGLVSRAVSGLTVRVDGLGCFRVRA